VLNHVTPSLMYSYIDSSDPSSSSSSAISTQLDGNRTTVCNRTMHCSLHLHLYLYNIYYRCKQYQPSTHEECEESRMRCLSLLSGGTRRPSICMWTKQLWSARTRTSVRGTSSPAELSDSSASIVQQGYRVVERWCAPLPCLQLNRCAINT